MLNPYIIAYLPIAASSVCYFSIVYYLRDKLSSKIFWLISVSYFIVCGSGEWLGTNVGQDNFQWYFVAQNIFDDHESWLEHYSFFDHGRLFSYLPVLLLMKLGLESPIIIFNLLVLITYVIVSACSIKILKAYVTQINAHVAVAIFTMIISVFGQIQFWTFSSEHSVISLFLISLTLISSDVIGNKWRYLSLFFAGVALVMSVFAKDQYGLVGISTFTVYIIYLLYRRSWIQALFFSLGCLSVTGVVWMLCFRNFSWSLIESYYLLGAEYQNRSFVDQVPIELNLDIFLRFCKRTIFNWHFFSFQFAVIGVSGWFIYKKLKYPSTKIEIVPFLIFISYTLSMLTILIAKKDLQHYTHFLLPSFIFFLGCFLEIQKTVFEKKHHRILYFSFFFCVISIPLFTREMRAIYPIRGFVSNDEFVNRDQKFQTISRYIPTSSSVLLWGYANHYMVNLKAKRSSAFLITQFAFPPLESSAFVRSQYLVDLERERPQFVLELVGPSMEFTTNKLKHSISEAHPAMAEYLNHNYLVVLDSCDIRIYRRK